jgi:hypothetical protein
MPAYARKQIVDETEVGIYHCVSRCVRRAFLCGQDALTGRSYDHRKVWIQGRLEELAAILAVDVLGFSVMSNHLHLLLRNRPDIAARWSDEQVARRWWRLHPGRHNEDGSPAEPEPHELALLTADAEALAVRRQRLSSISWWMRSLCEPMARRANREDGVTGRFWEGRCSPRGMRNGNAGNARSPRVEPRLFAAFARRLPGVARLDGQATGHEQARRHPRRAASDSRTFVDQRRALARHGKLVRALVSPCGRATFEHGRSGWPVGPSLVPGPRLKPLSL